MLTGQNGILKRAGEASDKTGKANIVDQAKLDIIDKQTENEGSISKEELHDILKEYFTNVPSVDDEAWDNFPEGFPTLTATEEYGGYEGIEVEEIYKGLLEKGKRTLSPEEVVKDLKTHIGAYVNYGIDLDGNSSTPDWRIFYAQDVDGESRVYLIAADYVPTDLPQMVEAMNKVGLGNVLNSGYGSLNVTWDRAFEYEDDYEYKALTLPNWKKLFKDGDYLIESSNLNKMYVTSIRETTNWSSFKAKGADYVIGGPTVQMWCAAWNLNMPESGTNSDGFMKITADSYTKYGYKFSSDLVTDVNYINADGTKYVYPDEVLSNDKLEKLQNDKMYNLFFPHTERDDIYANGTEGSSARYYLSSTAGCQEYTMLTVDYLGCIWGISFHEGFAGGVRPLVCLKSNVKLQETGNQYKEEPVYDIDN